MEITLRPTKRGWCTPKEGRKYAANTGRKKSYSYFRKGLRHVRLENGRILNTYDWIDEFLLQFEEQSERQKVADEMVESLQ